MATFKRHQLIRSLRSGRLFIVTKWPRATNIKGRTLVMAHSDFVLVGNNYQPRGE